MGFDLSILRFGDDRPGTAHLVGMPGVCPLVKLDARDGEGSFIVTCHVSVSYGKVGIGVGAGSETRIGLVHLEWGVEGGTHNATLDAWPSTTFSIAATSLRAGFECPSTNTGGELVASMCVTAGPWHGALPTLTDLPVTVGANTDQPSPGYTVPQFAAELVVLSDLNSGAAASAPAVIEFATGPTFAVIIARQNIVYNDRLEAVRIRVPNGARNMRIHNGATAGIRWTPLWSLRF